ncbi:MAG: glycosyltransferase [Pseudomonadota bacterium]
MGKKDFAEEFVNSPRPHILMVTNHGMHDWEVRSGLTDTGGQNHYVNHLSDTLVCMGFKVTTLNRGGFLDPITKQMREGAIYKDENSRIVYLKGGGNKFIRKEDLNKVIIGEEVEYANEFFSKERLNCKLIISHYWDGAMLAHMLKERMNIKAKHIWVPHSLGALKKENYKNKPKEVIEACRFEERIAYENELLPKCDAVASTSGDISRTLKQYYDHEAKLSLPPCIDTDSVHPMEPTQCSRIYDFLKKSDPVSGSNVLGKKCVLEVSRTDKTKRKDLLIKAFAKAHKSNPESMLLLTLSSDSKEVYDECMTLMKAEGIRDKVVILGMIPRDLIRELYAITTVYCSPSEMEGFGMSVQEACACRRPTVSSNLVPFAVEYLLSNAREENVGGKIRWGDAGVVINAGNTEGFAYTISKLLKDSELRNKIAANAYTTTIPYFTWPTQTQRMLTKVGINIPQA